MKLPCFISVLLLLAACSTTPVSVTTPVAPTNHEFPAGAAPGKIEALIVAGTVQLVSPDGNTVLLTKGRIFSPGSTVITGPDSETTLVLSNGAVMRLQANEQVKFSVFVQAPFDESVQGTFLRLTHDPSYSDVVVEVQKGVVQGELKPLNKDAGSSFLVITPEGSVMSGEEYFTHVNPLAATPPAGEKTPSAQQIENEEYVTINRIRAEDNLPHVTPPAVAQPKANAQ